MSGLKWALLGAGAGLAILTALTAAYFLFNA
jgi:hypothetical protein